MILDSLPPKNIVRLSFFVAQIKIERLMKECIWVIKLVSCYYCCRSSLFSIMTIC